MVVRLSLYALVAFVSAATATPAFAGRMPSIATAPAAVKSMEAGGVMVTVFADGSYGFVSKHVPGTVLRAHGSADLVGMHLDAAMYPRHAARLIRFEDELGSGQALVSENTGLVGKPDVICEVRLYNNQSWGDMRTTVRNSTPAHVEVHAIGILQTDAGSAVDLHGPEAEDRVLSDSYSEDSPQLQVMELGEPANGMHLGFGSQLIYNRKSRMSLFLGALSANRFLTVFHLQVQGHGADAHIASYDAEATGTEEGQPEQHRLYAAGNNPPLRLRVAPGESLSSERVMFAIGPDYHQQLEEYGRAVRILNKARVTTPTPIGWWSWTAFYYGVSQANVLTNAQWLAQNLAPLGYRYFQVDEGYQYARGEYATADAKAFPRGMEYVGDRVRALGLTFGVWVAPFQVSERSRVFEDHPDWLVRTAGGEPIHIGKVGGLFDNLYALDTTNPGAQEYLRSTYRTLVHQWGVRFIKMDFMDSSAVEGTFYRPNTTALEAQRIGLQVIRDAVGEDVVLDKDGSPMLTPVGIVDAGRTSQDTGHTFESTRDAAPGVAARWYMNRNFYVTDPDAFSISTQTVPDRGWHGNKLPLTLDEAECSIALSAVSGGMFEIGDDLPTLGSSAERMTLVRNGNLVDMARLGRAARPMDLMTYEAADRQPSIFLLKQNRKQQVLTVFNWTEQTHTHTLSLKELGLAAEHAYSARNLLRGGAVDVRGGALTLTQPPHSVRMITLIDDSVKDPSPEFRIQSPPMAAAGQGLELSAAAADENEPVLRYTWNFGDGISDEGTVVSHAYTVAGSYTITVTGTGFSQRTTQHKTQITVTGFVPTRYDPSAKERLEPRK